MATQKTIRVSWETYKKIMDLADARGIAVADAVDYLIEKGQAQAQELRERLAYFDSLERELKRYWDETLCEDAWQGWDSLMNLLEGQRMNQEWAYQRIQELEGQLKQLQSLLQCSICGKADGLALTDAWIKFLREQMKKAGWGHGACFARQKQAIK